MGKNEVALEIVLALIEKGLVYTGENNKMTGEEVSELYNAIHKSINCINE